MTARVMHCPACGCRIRKGTRSLDHLWPKSLGGTKDDRYVICKKCNVRKGNRLPTNRESAAFSKQLGTCAK